MNITRNNIIEEYPKIDQDILPDVLKQSEFDFLSENIDLYGEDDTIDKFIDTFIKKLNENITKKTKQSKAKTKQSKSKARQSKPKSRQSRAKTKQSKAKTKKKTEKQNVNAIDLQISILKSYYLLLDKEVLPSRLLGLYRKIEKAALEKKIRKTDKYASVIENISQNLANEYNESRKIYKITASNEDKQKLKEIAYSQHVRKSVSLLKRYANIVGKETPEKIKKLLTAIEKENIGADDPYYNKIKDISARLKKKSNSLSMLKSDLRGLNSKKKTYYETIDNLSGIMSSKEIKEIHFETMDFSGKWFELIGNPSFPFYFMIYGKPGSGKSTLTIEFAKYLALEQNLKVLFWSKEEGISQTFQEKLNRLNAFDKNLFVSEKLPSDLSDFDVLIIDSVNDARLEPEHIENIQQKFPKLSLVMIFQSTKDGQFKGYNTWEHWVQTVIQVKEGKAETGKNRFGAKSIIDIF